MDKAITENDILSARDLAELPIRQLLERLAVLLPSQGVITNFVHHNTLHHFQSMPFEDAVVESARIYGAAANPMRPGVRTLGLSSNGLRERRDARLDISTDERVKSFMIRVTGCFLDQGLAPVSMPYRSEGLWRAVQKLSEQSIFSFSELSHKKTKQILRLPAERALESLLDILVPRKTLRPRYLTEVLLLLKGWAGLCWSIEQDPSSVEHGRSISLMEWVTLLLLVEFNVLLNAGGIQNISITDSDADTLRRENDYPDFTAFHRAEWRDYESIIRQLAHSTPQENASTATATAQAIFCIDDREFSLRRYLESVAPDIETYGAPGFFGLDIQLTDNGEHRPVKLCPPLVKAHINVRLTRKGKKARLQTLFWKAGTANLFSGWIVSQVFGLPTGLQLLARILLPSKFGKRRLSLDFNSSSNFTSMRSEFSDDKSSEMNGFTIDEAAQRIKGFLDTIGFPDKTAPIVALVGHGASSTNNPYFAAYDCGACSGRPGSLNARIFARLANDTAVRRRMRELGRTIDPETLFIPILHDTTADHFQFLSEKVDLETQRHALKVLRQALNDAAGANALNRCRHFNKVGAITSKKSALEHVKIRASSWFEPRPEYNHATNIAAIVGPRWLTKGLESERAIFLNSYDPASDQDGTVIGLILSAVIPVCGGINLEYFFSRLDPEIYGAGNKLPQNIVANVGVMTGLESDLRTGLPMQMTEIHDSRRLLVYVLQSPEKISAGIADLPEIRQWVENRWIHFIAQDPNTLKQFHFKDRKWVPLTTIPDEYGMSRGALT